MNKGIARIQYNFLALPSQTTFGSADNFSTYLYDADGKKRKVTYKSGSAEESKDYCSNVVYEKTKAQTSETGKMLNRQANHAQRVAGNNPRPSRAQKANKAIQKAQSYGENTKIIVSTTISTVGNKTIGMFEDLEINWEWQRAYRKQ